MSASRAALAALTLGLLPLAGCGRQDQALARAVSPLAAVAVARGYVDDADGGVRVAAPRDGVVDRVLVEEGDRVARGQVLATMEDAQARLGLEAAQAEVGQRRAEISLAQAKLAAAQRDAGRTRRLAGQGAATMQDADTAATAVQIAAAESAQAGQALRAAIAQENLHSLEVEVRTLRAPIAGQVLRRTAIAGGAVSAAAPMFILESSKPRVVRAELDESLADAVHPGMVADVTREFDDAPSYRAHVLRVADNFSIATLSDDPTARADTRVVVVVLSLDDAPSLKLGQRVLARFRR